MTQLFAPIAALFPRNRMPVLRDTTMPRTALPPADGYRNFARAYSTNELVFACIEMLATSAGEPHIVGRKWQRESPKLRNVAAADVADFIHGREQELLAKGLSHREVKNTMIRNGFFKEMPSHSLIKLLREPNPWMSRGQLWGTIVMDRALAGNAYLFKARRQGGLANGTVAELWRLRPDRVKIVPHPTEFISHYEYGTGNDKLVIPANDIIHFKTRNPFDDYYGMPPLMAASGRVDIDGYMREFLRNFFERGGTGPGAILSVKQKVDQAGKDTIRDTLRRQFGHQGGYQETIILDQAETTYTPLGLNRGLRDALPKELDAVSEARITMVFGIPGSILGLLISYAAGSGYAGKRSDWQVFWDLTMRPLLSDFDDVLNLHLVPEFGLIDEVLFDLSDIWALREDMDKLHERARANLAVGGLGLREFREAIGVDPDLVDDVLFVPRLSTPTPAELLGEVVLPDAAEKAEEEQDVALPDEDEPVSEPVPEAQALLSGQVLAEVHCPHCDRWIGRNINVGATVYCRGCKNEGVVRAKVSEAPEPEPVTTVTTVQRDAEGRLTGTRSTEVRE